MCSFLHWGVDSLGAVFWVPCRFWILEPYQMNSWTRFSPIPWVVSWVYWLFVQKLFSLMQSHLFILSLNCWAIGVLFRKSLPLPRCSSVFPIVSCICFKGSSPVLSLIHFEVILVQGERQGFIFSLLYVDIQFSQQHLLKRLSFLHPVFWAPLSRIGYSYMDLCLSLLFCNFGLHVCFCADTMLFLLL
jgi:hypothetical protein